VIQAQPETVFRFFMDSARWSRWWGTGSTIEPQPGGKVYIRHPDGTEALGEVLEIRPPEHLVFTYGFASGKPMPAGSSRVTIHLAPDERGTRLELLHEFADTAAREAHVQGWRFQLSLFANAVADEVFANASGVADAWFDAWSIVSDSERDGAFARIAAKDIRFYDRYSSLEGMEELSAHAGAALRFMPGVRLERKGEVRHCQGTVLADWIVPGPEGNVRMSGTNVFVMGPDGRIASVTGIAN
jgi:uncharacterized protein YndB with AHSA1/START domain